MGLFSRRSEIDVVKAAAVKQHPRMAALAEGTLFDLELNARVLPSGVGLVNRFFHGPPTSWTNAYRDAVAAQSADESVGDSFKKLLGVLSRVAAEPAPEYAHRALEESVTVHLTVAALAQAVKIVAAHPMLGEVVGDTPPMWTDDGVVDAVADMLRGKLSACDAALESNTSGIQSRHADCMLFAAMALSVEGDVVARNQDSLRLLIADADPDDYLWRQMNRFKSATGYLATFIESLGR